MVVSGKKDSFVVFSNCVLVKGKDRLAIYDLNGKVYLTDKQNEQLLSSIFDKRIVPKNKLEDNLKLEDAIRFLESKGLGIWMSGVVAKHLTSINFNFDTPYTITNAILDINYASDNYTEFIDQLSDLNCPFLQCRFYPDTNIHNVEQVIECANANEIRSIQLMIPFRKEDEFVAKLNTLLHKYNRISEIIIYSVPVDYINNHKPTNSLLRLTEHHFENESSCGKIERQFFVPSLGFYSEALQFNTCLNKKVSLTVNGYIKNCPSLNITYGHITHTTLYSVVNSFDFQKLWHLKKDLVEVCKDCELRYMCSDCRAYTIKNCMLSKPAKCSYNPYIEINEQP